MINYLHSALMTLLMVAISLSLVTLALYGLRALGRISGKRLEVSGEPAGAGTDEELAAVLAAAAHAVLRRPVRIRRIHLHHDSDDDLWSRAGRVDIMHSHRLEPRR
jgi:hypothetical protein